MSNVISINKGNKRSNDFLGAYIEAQNNRRIPEEIFFVAGAILTVGLPEFIFSIYGGLIPFFVFASSLLVGAGSGLANYYYRSPYLTLSLSDRAGLQVPPGKKDTTDKAA